MALFSDTVPRDQYDDMRRQRDDALARAQIADDRVMEVMRELMAVKRHDLGMVPSGFAPPADPLASSPRTLLAVEEFAAGDAELRKRLVATAVLEIAAARSEGASEAEADTLVAQLIRRGDG